jgi:hypothetical protein
MICLRLDLDYVPWDAVNAEKYGHGEPAIVLKLLDLARQTGIKFHFFVSNRSLRTFPTTADAILGEGHDLDWLTHYPDDADLFLEARELFTLAGHKIEGVATDLPWPAGSDVTWLSDLNFLTAPTGPHPEHLAFFPETGRADADILPFGLGKQDVARAHGGPEGGHGTIVAQPMILAKVDPSLKHFRELINVLNVNAIPVRTLRDATRELQNRTAAAGSKLD